MTKTYSQLNQVQRYQLEALLKTNISKSKIADVMGVHRSTIYRELKRNSTHTISRVVYKAATAQLFFQKRAFVPPARLSNKNTVTRRIRWLLSRDWSPEQIACTCARRNIEMLSTEGIYLWIYDQKKQGNDYTGQLRRHHRKRRKRRLKNNPRLLVTAKKSIHERPPEVAQQTRAGDLETDLVQCTNGYLLTVTDRKSLFNLIGKIPDKQANTVQNALIRLLMPYKPFIKTITSDNGTEFANHIAISSAIECNWYFADPYKSQQRGTNENQNGLIRPYFKNKTDLNSISDQYIKNIQKKINNRPRKKLNFDSPDKIFHSLI